MKYPASANVEPIFSSTQSSEQLRKNMVSNERDSFRHEVGIGVPEGGQFSVVTVCNTRSR